MPLIVLWVLVNGLSLVFKTFLQKNGTDISVVIAANTLLFLICMYGLLSQLKLMSSTNPHAMVRGVMGSVVLKLFVLGTAAFVYLYAAGENKSVNALFVSMGLYLVYTWLEVRIAMGLNPPKHGGN